MGGKGEGGGGVRSIVCCMALVSLSVCKNVIIIIIIIIFIFIMFIVIIFIVNITSST